MAEKTTTTAKPKTKAQVETENAELKEQLAQMMEMIKAMQTQQSVVTPVNNIETDDFIDEDESIDIPMTKMISVTSVFDGEVTLKTSTDSHSKKYTLSNIGQKKQIPYENLIDCIITDPFLFEEGYVIINNKDVIKAQDLEQYYDKFLTPSKVKDILKFDSLEIETLLSNASTVIKEVVCSIVAKEIADGKKVDLNKVAVIETVCNVNLKEVSSRLK